MNSAMRRRQRRARGVWTTLGGGTPPPPPPPPGQGFPYISINSSGQYVNGSNGVGTPIQLWGVNLSALEFVGVQQFGNVSSWGGVIPNWNALATWGPNICRVPWNAGSLLGRTARTIRGGVFTGSALKEDPQNNYTQTLIDAVGYIQQTVKAYVYLDLHWTCPSNWTDTNGVTANILAEGQPCFTDYSCGYPAYQKLFSLFANGQPGQKTSWGYTINNNGIIFEAQNEPYLTDVGYSAGSTALVNLMKGGGNVSKFSWSINSYSVSGSIPVLGYQPLLNLLRTYGTNILFVGGDAFMQDTSYGLSILPTDTLSPPQVGFAMHPYPAESNSNYSDGNYFAAVGNDKFLNPSYSGSACFTGILKILANKTPVMFSEDGDNCGTAATGSAAPLHVQNCTWPFASDSSRKYAVGWIGWQWNNMQSSSYNSHTPSLYPYMTYTTDFVNPLPLVGYGVATKAQLLSLNLQG